MPTCIYAYIPLLFHCLDLYQRVMDLYSHSTSSALFSMISLLHHVCLKLWIGFLHFQAYLYLFALKLLMVFEFVVLGIFISVFEVAFPLFFSRYGFRFDWLSMIICLKPDGWNWSDHTKNAQFYQHRRISFNIYALISPICFCLCSIFTKLHFGNYLSIFIAFFHLWFQLFKNRFANSSHFFFYWKLYWFHCLLFSKIA